LRRNKEKYHESIDDDAENGSIASKLMDESFSGDADKQIEIQELKNKLNDSLLKLSEEHRAVVTLYDIQGLSGRCKDHGIEER
jgi:RNA polymerase sigma-70 factor (ECF subfamily)